MTTYRCPVTGTLVEPSDSSAVAVDGKHFVWWFCLSCGLWHVTMLTPTLAPPLWVSKHQQVTP